MIYSYRGWHTVTGPCLAPAKEGGICIHVKTHMMSGIAFHYYDSWSDVPAVHQDLRHTPEWKPC